MRIQRAVRITGFSEKKGLEIHDLGLYLTRDTFRVQNVPFSKNLIGKTLVVTLTPSEKIQSSDLKDDELLITALKKTSLEERVYIIPQRTKTTDYLVDFFSNIYNTLTLRLNSSEYTSLKKLPLKMGMKVCFRIE